jgi:hypothetical protein
VAQINSIRFTRGYHSQRAAVALPGSFHRHPPSVVFIASGSRRLSSSLTGRAIQYWPRRLVGALPNLLR